MINKRGQKPGIQRGNRQRFPYEPRVVGGKLMMPAELQTIHRYVVETPVLENVTEEIRAVVETVWTELMSKLVRRWMDCRAPHPQGGALLLRPSSALILFEAGILGLAGVRRPGAVHGAAPLTSDERKTYRCSEPRLHPPIPRTEV